VDDGTQEKGLLGRLSVIVGILAGIAAIASVGWTIFHQDNTDVAGYQSQVVATCEQVHNVLGAQHGEVFAPGFGDPSDPGAAFQVRRDRLAQVIEGNLAQTHIAFDALNGRAVPDVLGTRHAEAVSAQRAWFATMERVVRTITGPSRAHRVVVRGAGARGLVGCRQRRRHAERRHDRARREELSGHGVTAAPAHAQCLPRRLSETSERCSYMRSRAASGSRSKSASTIAACWSW
jgi:hypothetical protein